MLEISSKVFKKMLNTPLLLFAGTLLQHLWNSLYEIKVIRQVKEVIFLEVFLEALLQETKSSLGVVHLQIRAEELMKPIAINFFLPKVFLNDSGPTNGKMINQEIFCHCFTMFENLLGIDGYFLSKYCWDKILSGKQP